MHGMLPHEVVCTENLTPFLKLLPCKGKAGVASLLDGHKVFDANWQTMAIDIRSVCDEDDDALVQLQQASSSCSWQIEQTVDMVLDLQRSMRPRDNPIPRPPPLEDVLCDETKHYNAPDTCFPRDSDVDRPWSLSQIFGRPIKGSCPLGDRTAAADVVLEIAPEQTVRVITDSAAAVADNSLLPSSSDDSPSSSFRRSYQIAAEQDFDLQVDELIAANDTTTQQTQHRPLLRASRHMTGYGQERGGMHATISNPHPHAYRVVYMESLPWFLRPYMHTLHVSGGGAEIKQMFYTPAADRRKGTQLELLLEIPAHADVTLTYDFEKAILRYTEYPPDANRGFDVAPAIVRVLPKSGGDDASQKENEEGGGGGQGDSSSYLRTTSLLLPLPTPDFSMPYNVIILTSTVIALGFGSIFNLLIRRFVLADEVPKSPLGGAVKEVIGRIRARIMGKGVKSEGAEETDDEPPPPPFPGPDRVIRGENATTTTAATGTDSGGKEPARDVTRRNGTPKTVGGELPKNR